MYSCAEFSPSLSHIVFAAIGAWDFVHDVGLVLLQRAILRSEQFSTECVCRSVCDCDSVRAEDSRSDFGNTFDVGECDVSHISHLVPWSCSGHEAPAYEVLRVGVLGEDLVKMPLFLPK